MIPWPNIKEIGSIVDGNDQGRKNKVKYSINIKYWLLITTPLMDHFEKKEQDYTKWDENIWLSVEKAISQFQHKVTESMLKIG